MEIIGLLTFFYLLSDARGYFFLDTKDLVFCIEQRDKSEEPFVRSRDFEELLPFGDFDKQMGTDVVREPLRVFFLENRRSDLGGYAWVEGDISLEQFADGAHHGLYLDLGGTGLCEFHDPDAEVRSLVFVGADFQPPETLDHYLGRPVGHLEYLEYLALGANAVNIVSAGVVVVGGFLSCQKKVAV